MRKPIIGISDQVRQLRCRTTEDGLRLEILHLGSRGIALCNKNEGADDIMCL